MRIDLQLNNNRMIDYGKNQGAKASNEKNNSLEMNVQNKNANPMEELQKIKDSLVERKNKLKEMTMDPEEKKQKLKQMDEEITLIEAQMQQMAILQKQQELDEKNAKIEKKHEEDNNKKIDEDEVRDGVIISASLNNLIKARNSMDHIHRLKQIKNNEAVEAGYLGSTENPNSFNARRMEQIKKSAVNADMNILKEIGNMSKAANRSSKAIKEKVEEVNEARKAETKEVDKADKADKAGKEKVKDNI
jgi:hypothetical protein